MFNKKLAGGIVLVVAFAGVLGYFILSEETEETPPPPSQEVEIKSDSVLVPEAVVSPKHVSVKPIKKANLYNDTDKLIPLSGIVSLSELPEGVKNSVNNVLKASSSGIYFIKKTDNKIIVISSNEDTNIRRHDFKITEINPSGEEIVENIPDENSRYDKWSYENELPVYHSHYSPDKELLYTEFWNYNEDEPIKYKKTDKDGNVISIRKETIEDGVNLKEDNIFYDSKGNMLQNVSLNYEGMDLTRFTYYNSQVPSDSGMIVNEYQDGLKKQETLYTSDYKVEHVYIPKYIDGQKTEIKILNSEGSEAEVLYSDP